MGSLPAPAVLSTSPQQCLDRLKHTILNVSDAVADIERLDAAPSPDSLTPGETAALVLLRGEMLTAIKERLTDLQEASPSLVRMARGESPSHREVDRAFLTSITEKLDALEQATRTRRVGGVRSNAERASAARGRCDTQPAIATA